MKKTFSILLCVIALNFLMIPQSQGAFLKKKELSDYQQILTVLKVDLDVKTSRKGDVFMAKLMDAIFYDEKTILIPAESVLLGQIIKAQKANWFKKNSYIRFTINSVTSPAGEVLILNPPYITEVFAPDSKKMKNKLLSRLPSSIAYSGSSFLLGQSSSLAQGAIWGISVGAGMCAGAISGFIAPDKNKTKQKTGMSRVFNATPVVSSLNIMLSKSSNFSLKSGEYITIYLNKNAIKLMKGS